MDRTTRHTWFDWRDFLHLPGIVPPELASVRVGSIVGVLIGGLAGAYLYSSTVATLIGGFAGAYVGQTAAFVLRRVIGEDFLGTLLRVAIRIAFGAGGAAGVAYGIYGALQIVANGRLWAIGSVAFFVCPGIFGLVAAIAPNLLFGYSKPAIGLTLGCVCLLLTLSVVVSMVIHPSLVWLVALVFCAVPDVTFLLRPRTPPRMSFEEAFWGANGIFGFILRPPSNNEHSPTADPTHTDDQPGLTPKAPHDP